MLSLVLTCGMENAREKIQATPTNNARGWRQGNGWAIQLLLKVVIIKGSYTMTLTCGMENARENIQATPTSK